MNEKLIKQVEISDGLIQKKDFRQIILVTFSLLRYIIAHKEKCKNEIKSLEKRVQSRSNKMEELKKQRGAEVQTNINSSQEAEDKDKEIHIDALNRAIEFDKCTIDNTEALVIQMIGAAIYLEDFLNKLKSQDVSEKAEDCSASDVAE